MPIEYFKSDDGMLTIEKSSTSNTAQLFSAGAKEPETKIDGELVIETIGTYMMPGFSARETNTHGKCVICGIETEYSNRHICPYCFGVHEKEILDQLQENNSGRDVVV